MKEDGSKYETLYGLVMVLMMLLLLKKNTTRLTTLKVQIQKSVLTQMPL